ncbi:MAG: hypothetical protein LBE91_07660 [Tannerella sp.]|jgi:antitoxin component YwqK of YwqJK toxin-antitoxin module|nr:hypothetical protein [Tannerella sp.]
MRKTIILILLISTISSCQKKNREDTEYSNYKIIETIMERNDEKFDFEAARKYRKESYPHGILIGDTIRVIFTSESEPAYTDYFSAINFYQIEKNFYVNGVIKNKANWFGHVRFGTYEEYDESGNCIKKVNEDKKFGGIRREDIIRYLEKEGWFNHKTGENKVAYENPLKTDGTFYREIIRYIDINFIEAKYDRYGKEIEPPVWHIIIEPRFEQNVTEYKIDGNTGKGKMREYHVHREI